MLTYLVQVTENILIVAILSGFVFGYAWHRYGHKRSRIVTVGCAVGWAGAITLAILKTATKLVDSGLWNLRFVGVYTVGLLLFAAMLIGPLYKKLGKAGVVIQQVGLAALLVGVTGYMAPVALASPYDIVNAVTTLVSTDFFFRMVGWLLCLVLMLLVGMGIYKVLIASSEKLATIALGVGSLTTGALLGGLALRAMITRRIIPQSPAAFKIAVFASNNNLLFSCIMAALAVACVVALFVAAARQKEPYSNPAQHRKIRAKWRHHRRWAAVAGVCLALSILNLTAIKAYDSREVELSPSEDCELRDDGCYIPFEQVEDGHLHRFTYESENGVGIRFIIIKKPGGSAYGIGLDACDICGETGYYERDGNQVVCKLCDVVMNVQTIGFKGGCNPIVIDYDIRDGYIHIPYDTLLEHEDIFTR